MGKPIIWNGINAKLINSGDLIDANANSLTNGGKANYTWTSHGLTVGGTADIGRPVYLINATTLAFSDQTLSANAEVVGFIYAVLDANTVRVIFAGEIPTVGSSFLEGGGSLVPGTVYFLSATAGKVTATEPTTIGYVSKPLGVAVSTTRFSAFNMRGSVVGSANARTQITLANNATTDVQDVSLYDAGSIEGWVYIDAPTDIRFYVKAPFSKYGAAANYYISPSYVGDTPPAGYSMTVTAAGKIQITLPNVSGYASAVINFALNAPAVGTNFPLNLDSANLSNSGITGITGAAATAANTAGSNKIGEVFAASRARASALSLTNNVTASICGPITLSAGIYNIIGTVGVIGTGTTTASSTAIQGFIDKVSAGTSGTFCVQDSSGQICAIITNVSHTTTNLEFSSNLISSAVVVSSSQTYYLNCYAAFSAGTVTAYGQIRAIRIA